MPLSLAGRSALAPRLARPPLAVHEARRRCRLQRCFSAMLGIATGLMLGDMVRPNVRAERTAAARRLARAVQDKPRRRAGQVPCRCGSALERGVRPHFWAPATRRSGGAATDLAPTGTRARRRPCPHPHLGRVPRFARLDQLISSCVQLCARTCSPTLRLSPTATTTSPATTQGI
jgi:hypothetical protein